MKLLNGEIKEKDNIYIKDVMYLNFKLIPFKFLFLEGEYFVTEIINPKNNNVEVLKISTKESNSELQLIENIEENFSYFYFSNEIENLYSTDFLFKMSPEERNFDLNINNKGYFRKNDSFLLKSHMLKIFIQKEEERIVSIYFVFNDYFEDHSFKVGETDCFGRILVIDPCYNNVSSGIILENCFYGKWNFFIRKSFIYDTYGLYCLFATSSNLEEHEINELVSSVGVDSGQMSIIDYSYYPMNEEDFEEFYDDACSKSFPAGMITGGAVSSTFFGDGEYSVFIHKDDNGKIDGIKIIFIEDVDE